MDPGKGQLIFREMFQNTSAQEFPDGPVIRTCHFPCWSLASVPGQGTDIS